MFQYFREGKDGSALFFRKSFHLELITIFGARQGKPFPPVFVKPDHGVLTGVDDMDLLGIEFGYPDPATRAGGFFVTNHDIPGLGGEKGKE